MCQISVYVCVLRCRMRYQLMWKGRAFSAAAAVSEMCVCLWLSRWLWTFISTAVRSLCICYYPLVWRAMHSVTSVCARVCVCVSICLCLCVFPVFPVCALTFESGDPQTSSLMCQYIIQISKSHLFRKAMVSVALDKLGDWVSYCVIEWLTE